jgi:hypothetical protein
MNLEVVYQRDLNRVSDADRMVRKKGLQKLHESLPWKTKKSSEKQEILHYMINTVFRVILSTISDPVEKCREYSLKLVSETTVLWKNYSFNDASYELLVELTNKLCERCNDIPFPEVSEELRLLISEILFKIVEKDYEIKNFKNSTEKEEKKAIDSAESSQTAVTVSSDSRIVERILSILPKFLSDAFPSVKRSLAELLCFISDHFAFQLQSSLSLTKNIIKGLEVNAVHQHSKTRSLTILALGKCLSCLPRSSYEKIMEETMLTLFQKLLCDRTSSVKMDLCNVLSNLLEKRLFSCQFHYKSLLTCDFTLIVYLLILSSDTIEEIKEKGKTCLAMALSQWKGIDAMPKSSDEEDREIEDGELALREAKRKEGDVDSDEVIISISNSSNDSAQHIKTTTSTATTSSRLSTEQLHSFFSFYLSSILPIILNETEEHWTSEKKIMYLSSLTTFIELSGNAIDEHSHYGLSLLLPVILHHIREEEHDIRLTAEKVVYTIGSFSNITILVDTILPLIVNENLAGGDSSSSRMSALRVLTQFLKGYKHQRRQGQSGEINPNKEKEGDQASEVVALLERIVISLNSSVLLNHRDLPLRESLLLLLRCFIEYYSTEILSSLSLQRYLSLLFIYLCARCPNEHDSVPDVAKKELFKLSKLFYKGLTPAEGKNQDEIIESFLSLHYLFILYHILFSSPSSVSSSAPALSSSVTPSPTNENDFSFETLSQRISKEGYVPPIWDYSSSQKASFESLLNHCLSSSWKYFNDLLLPIFIFYTKPKAILSHDSMESNMLSYASQRGEEVIPSSIEEMDIRLHFILLLENMIRYLSSTSSSSEDSNGGGSRWEYTKYLTISCQKMFETILLPNLIWRVGRVEGTIRKISLAVTYHILKCGGISYDTLVKIATELIPLLIHHIDDNETSIRLMICLSLTVIFDRLPGIFAEQTINELYPKLISRFDDSNDEIRIISCTMLEKFFHCGLASSTYCYHDTMLDYILTQVFIHLDDSNESLQEALMKLILFIGNTFPKQKQLIISKAETNRNCHRTPKYCDQILFEIKGIEILDS